MRMGLPPLPSLHEEVERGAGMPRVGSASHLPACAPDAITPSAGAGGGQGRLPWGPHSPRPSTQAWQDGPPRLSRSKGGAGGGGPEGGAQAAAAARPQLGAMGSGFFMAMSGTALARAAKAQRGAVGGEAAAAGGSRGGSPFTAGWGPAAGGMASVAHLPKEPSSPRGASPQCGLQLAPRTQSERLARGSSGLVQVRGRVRVACAVWPAWCALCKARGSAAGSVAPGPAGGCRKLRAGCQLFLRPWLGTACRTAPRKQLPSHALHKHVVFNLCVPQRTLGQPEPKAHLPHKCLVLRARRISLSSGTAWSQMQQTAHSSQRC